MVLITHLSCLNFLASILSANDELTMVLKSHGQMMHRYNVVRAMLGASASGASNVVQNNSLLHRRELANPMPLVHVGIPTSIHSEIVPTTRASTAAAAAPESANPFADEPYFVSDPSYVASVIRSE